MLCKIIRKYTAEYRACVSYYQYCILSMYIISYLRYSTSSNGVPLKSALGSFKSLKMASYDRSHTRSYSSSVVSMAISCIVTELERDIGRNSRFVSYPSYPLLHNNTWRKWLQIFHAVFSPLSQIPGLSVGVYRFCKSLCLHTAHARRRQTDRRKCDLNSCAFTT